ncbi:Phytosulfokines 2 [Apostasia shenzhenica]|uniref:Phytosulfokine n=1 Tax=Apostasia shenzhenica TaxID=1088818 RepID=A0A2I0BDX1_9ASPA|nr:Phytosulfokines 2 [Apostasia shenzhenica]
MAKGTAFLVLIALILSLSIARAARPHPMEKTISAEGASYGDQNNAVNVDDQCEGVEEEECLMRRTLAAHTDYIYTQGKTSP